MILKPTDLINVRMTATEGFFIGLMIDEAVEQAKADTGTTNEDAAGRELIFNLQRGVRQQLPTEVK